MPLGAVICWAILEICWLNLRQDGRRKIDARRFNSLFSVEHGVEGLVDAAVVSIFLLFVKALIEFDSDTRILECFSRTFAFFGTSSAGSPCFAGS